ncbi:hypothetical protein A3E72_00835 [Candidatus Gottesmanbacteria bacterium RIFCSPHIGHO2_12_FULL_43_26]|nr:MAG: hypothetical protein A3E72_00835 [Candidatus Gottesmanbacteria bacterium RIFCSPHIGHO2_12_FULL_43_26]
MKIAIFNWRDLENPRSGGAEIVTHKYAGYMADHGHEVLVISPAFKGSLREETAGGIKIIRLGYPFPHNYLFHPLLVYFYYQKKLKNNVDLIIDQIHWVPFFTPLYVKEKIIVFIHEVAQPIWKRQFGTILGFIGRSFEPFFYLPYRRTRFLTVSQTSKNDLVKFNIPPGNIRIITSGFDIKPFKTPPVKNLNPSFIFLGRLVRGKNVEEVIQAFAEIKKRLKTARLSIVGNIEDKKYFIRLFSLVKKLSLSEAVDFPGFVSGVKKISLLKKCHLLLHASVSEGWGLVVSEAAACGTPAVVYNVPGLSQSVTDKKTGLICTSNHPSEMAKLVLKLMNNKKLYRQLQKFCLSSAKKNSWDKSLKEFSLYVAR